MQLCEQKKCYVYKRLNFLCYQNKNFLTIKFTCLCQLTLYLFKAIITNTLLHNPLNNSCEIWRSLPLFFMKYTRTCIYLFIFIYMCVTICNEKH